MVGFRLKSGDSLVVATHNQGKLREFRDLFDLLGVAVASSGELGVAEPEETGETFEENARLKAVVTAAETGRL
ncbi:MAG TPA: non-canonical purine NTP pyrophosphatase, partial [Geobacterales bacterium]|nr:non-canonical purine NTP pyrophosphatase [Geobacterales bacterium]